MNEQNIYSIQIDTKINKNVRRQKKYKSEILWKKFQK